MIVYRIYQLNSYLSWDFFFFSGIYILVQFWLNKIFFLVIFWVDKYVSFGQINMVIICKVLTLDNKLWFFCIKVNIHVPLQGVIVFAID